jgi:hypothetical protein
MEKTITVNGKMIAGTSVDSAKSSQVSKNRRDHLKVWREIYQDVRRQWAEAENSCHQGGKYRR